MTQPVDQILLFTPVFVTMPIEVARVREEDLVNVYIDLVETGTLIGYPGQTSIPVGDAVTLVDSVTIRGVSIPFERELDDKRIYWSAAQSVVGTDALIVVTLESPTGTFTLLNGTLPPGLSITSKGLITGRVTNITAPPAEYPFTIRYKNATHTHDRRFTMYAEGKDYPAFFNPEQLKPLVTEPEFGFQYRFLAKLDRGQGYAFTLDIYDPDGILPGFNLHKITGFRPNSGKYGGLPPEISIIDQTIEGVIAADACPGQYFFRIDLNDQGHDGAIFMIEVGESVADTIGVIPHVVWDTPEGNLGDIEETEPCYFAVSAHSVSAPPVVYGLAPYSSPLPDGLTVNPLTGLLYGVIPYVPSDTVISFRLRAQAGDVFADRIFSITALNWFDLDSIHQLRFRTRLADEQALLPVYQETIDPNLIFRADDPNFGFVSHPYVYVIKGLDGAKDLETAMRGNHENVVPRTNTDYHERIRLILGDHRFASARNSKGEVVYEVLYRELYDPMVKAGGFVITNDQQPIESLVRWPQSGPIPSYIFPASVKNMRLDLIHDIGFAMIAEDDRHRVGPNTHELQPLWMRSEQTQGVPSTIPGYQTVLLIAYLKPGSIKQVVKALNFAIDVGTLLTPSGHVYHFDKYYTTETAVVYQTTLDDQREDPQTVLDSVDTIFDEIDGDVVKYLN